MATRQTSASHTLVYTLFMIGTLLRQRVHANHSPMESDYRLARFTRAAGVISVGSETPAFVQEWSHSRSRRTFDEENQWK